MSLEGLASLIGMARRGRHAVGTARRGRHAVGRAAHKCARAPTVEVLYNTYSVSFVFGQLRYRARSLHSSGKAAADACRSPKTAGSCAKCCAIAQARHRCGRFRGYHAPRLSAALPGRRASAALGSRFLRERPANHARYLHQLLLTAGCALYGVQILVLHRRREVCCRGCLSSNLAANEE